MSTSASFTPERGDYTDLTPFRYWCQKVLPLVYDDSLSYYELLCKVVDYLNKTMEDVTTLNGDVTSMYSAYEQLQNYVNTYFDSLDITTEINAKLDTMASDGTLLGLVIEPVKEIASEKVTKWMDENITPTTPVIDTSLTVSGAAADAKATGDRINAIYSGVGVDDTYGTNAHYEGAGHQTYSGAWTPSTKTATLLIPTDLGSTTTALIYFSPRFVQGHKYKIAVRWDWTNADTVYYAYGMNRPSLSSVTGIQYFLNASVVRKGDIAVYTLDANADGYLGIGGRFNLANTFSFKIAVYDVTGMNMSGVSDNVFKTFEDTVVTSSSGRLSVIKEEADYSYNIDANTKNENWTALGDSLTAVSGNSYLTYTREKLQLSAYNNCGIGGTTVSGAENANAMYQDVRINSLDINSKCITVMGGTNDTWQEYYNDHPNSNYTGWGAVTRENHDVSTFCGAYNVMISKILYKFCRVAGYYSGVNYSGITQVPTAVDNFRLILLTPPQCYHASSDTISAENKQNGIAHVHYYVKQLAELWGLPCVDTWEMGMNDINKASFFANVSTDGTHINAFGHERLASLLVDKAVQVSRCR